MFRWAIACVALLGCGSGPPSAAPSCNAAVERGVRLSTAGHPATVCVGEHLDLRLDAWECATHRDVTDRALWSTDRLDVAAVERGVVHGRSPGSARIAARDGDLSAHLDVEVRRCATPDAGASDATSSDAVSDATSSDAVGDATSSDAAPDAASTDASDSTPIDAGDVGLDASLVDAAVDPSIDAAAD